MATKIGGHATMAAVVAAALAGAAWAASPGFTTQIRPVNTLGLSPGFAWRAGSLALADFNGDGKVDAIVPGLFMAGVCLVFNGGPQTWISTGPWPVALVAADLDGDGDQDVAVAEQDGGGVTILTNDGTGVLARTAFHATGNAGGPVGPAAVLAADLDKDGRLDLVVANRFAETVVVLHNTGSGFAVTQTVSASNEPNIALAAGGTWMATAGRTWRWPVPGMTPSRSSRTPPAC